MIIAVPISAQQCRSHGGAKAPLDKVEIKDCNYYRNEHLVAHASKIGRAHFVLLENWLAKKEESKLAKIDFGRGDLPPPGHMLYRSVIIIENKLELTLTTSRSI